MVRLLKLFAPRDAMAGRSSRISAARPASPPVPVASMPRRGRDAAAAEAGAGDPGAPVVDDRQDQVLADHQIAVGLLKGPVGKPGRRLALHRPAAEQAEQLAPCRAPVEAGSEALQEAIDAVIRKADFARVAGDCLHAVEVAAWPPFLTGSGLSDSPMRGRLPCGHHHERSRDPARRHRGNQPQGTVPKPGAMEVIRMGSIPTGSDLPSLLVSILEQGPRRHLPPAGAKVCQPCGQLATWDSSDGRAAGHVHGGDFIGFSAGHANCEFSPFPAHLRQRPYRYCEVCRKPIVPRPEARHGLSWLCDGCAVLIDGSGSRARAGARGPGAPPLRPDRWAPSPPGRRTAAGPGAGRSRALRDIGRSPAPGLAPRGALPLRGLRRAAGLDAIPGTGRRSRPQAFALQLRGARLHPLRAAPQPPADLRLLRPRDGDLDARALVRGH